MGLDLSNINDTALKTLVFKEYFDHGLVLLFGVIHVQSYTPRNWLIHQNWKDFKIIV